MMLDAQADAYGDGLDQATAHPYMWAVKPHYYSSHFYNWPYTYGLLFGLGLFAQYRDDPERFRVGYDDLLSRAGMDTAEELGARRSASTSPTRRSGRPASTCCAAASTDYDGARRRALTPMQSSYEPDPRPSSPSCSHGEPRYRRRSDVARAVRAARRARRR